jgi:hypothetical protein
MEWRIRIRMEPPHFGKPDPDSHQSENPDPEPQQSQNRTRIHSKVKIQELWRLTMEQICITSMSSRIRILFKEKSDRDQN